MLIGLPYPGISHQVAPLPRDSLHNMTLRLTSAKLCFFRDVVQNSSLTCQMSNAADYSKRMVKNPVGAYESLEAFIASQLALVGDE